VKKTAINLNRSAGAPAEFRTEHLRNTRLDGYRYANPLGADAVDDDDDDDVITDCCFMLLALLLDLEDGGGTYQTTRPHIPDDNTLVRLITEAELMSERSVLETGDDGHLRQSGRGGDRETEMEMG
jgi:hypothetical protein